MANGKLYLVPTPLDFGTAQAQPLAQVLPEQTMQTAASLRHWVAENAKSLRAFLKRVHDTHPLACPLQEMDSTATMAATLTPDPCWPRR
jgi:16S rRNA (cytidine1402-2'-O)-methyltransferase